MSQALPSPFLSTPTSLPLLVQGYENSFLEHVRTGLSSPNFLTQKESQPVRDLLEEGAPARSVGDTLFTAHGLSWCRQLRRKFGANDVSYSLRDARCLFEEFPFSQRKGELLNASFLENLGPLDRAANAVLEFRWPIRADVTMPLVPLLFGLSCIDNVLSPLGFTVYGLEEFHITMRVPSLTLMERSIAHFFGRRAVRFCMTAGPVPKTDVNALHKERGRAVGHPFGKEFADVSRTPPFGYPLHDVAHGLLISRDVPLWKGAAGTLLYGAIEETGLIGIAESCMEADMASLVNLEIGGQSLSRMITSARRRFPAEDFRRMIRLYAAKLEGVTAEKDEKAEWNRFRKRINSLR